MKDGVGLVGVACGTKRWGARAGCEGVGGGRGGGNGGHGLCDCQAV